MASRRGNSVTDTGLPTEPSVASARRRPRANAVDQAIASVDDRCSSLLARPTQIRRRSGNAGHETSPLVHSGGVVVDGKGHVLGIRRRNSTRSTPRARSRNTIVGTDSDTERSTSPSRRVQEKGPSQADTTHIYVNGVECVVSGVRVIPDLLFGPHVIFMDNVTKRLLLPNGIDGSVCVVEGRDYSTVRLRGGTADLLFAGVLEEDRRMIPRSWVLEKASSVYNAASSQFFASVPTLAEHVAECRTLLRSHDDEANIATHPTVLHEERFREFQQSLDRYRRRAADQAPVTSTAPAHASSSWADAAAGKARKRVTAFGVFVRENGGINLAACRAQFDSLSAEQKLKYARSAEEHNQQRGDVYPTAQTYPTQGDLLGPEKQESQQSRPQPRAAAPKDSTGPQNRFAALAAASTQLASQQSSVLLSQGNFGFDTDSYF